MGVIVLHTTETDIGTVDAVASYLFRTGNRPHVVFDPANGATVRMVQWDQAGAALRNLTGGVETNLRGDVFQVEIIGRAADVASYPDSWFETLAAALKGWCVETGVPAVFPCQWMPYPDSYGDSAVRLSPEAWQTVEGVIGHQHVPENDHGDPGDLSRLNNLFTQHSPEGLATMTPEQLAHALGGTLNLAGQVSVPLIGDDLQSSDLYTVGQALSFIHQELKMARINAAAPATGVSAAAIVDELASRLTR
jgi:hypothetical protein